jgi:hypothetical protein
VSTDLHAQLAAAVRARLEVARAYLDACGGSHGWCGDECEEFQQDNDAEAVTRYCERDLRVLERHRPFGGQLDKARRRGCQHCRNGGGACVEIRDMAVAYGLLDPTAGE